MTSESSSPLRDGRRAWIMLVVITTLTTAGMTVVLPVLPFVVLRYVSSPSDLAVWVGILETVNALCAFLVAPFLGRISDRFGRRPVIIVAGFGAALGFLLFGIGGALWVLLLGRIVQGVTAGDLPALFAYLADITPADRRARRFGVLGATAGIGTMIGPALGGSLAAIDVDLPVFVTAGLALTVAIVSIFLLPESLAPDRRIARLDLGAVHPFAVFRGVFRRPELRGLMVGLVLVGLPFGFFVNNFSVLALDAIDWNPTAIGLLTACVGIVDIAIQGVLLGFLLPRIGERGVVVSGIVAQAVGLVALAGVASLLAQPWLFVVGALILAAGQGAAQATMDGLLSNAVGDDEQGWIAGATQSLNAAVGTVAPLVAGLLYAHVAHAAPYLLGAVLMAAAAVVIARARFTSPSLRAKTPDAAEPVPVGE
ncbi:MFS transporter [Microbacterium sp. VKM Ac-2923]|uniref:MFS transporter n=1 Tax=Microbacterium sp. VKM Ac-2923 TaxID=2929476 RepID=UPI001FB38111|nr:MFS transporter [Microbacterium sp. VKM Ac-2923]MCJ1709125.1 MFS transporter [Microbacterium sp. VKM Ac-2923]